MRSETITSSGTVRRSWTVVLIVILLLTMFAVAGCGGDDMSGSGASGPDSTYTGPYTINSGPDTGQTGTIEVEPTGLFATDKAYITIKDSHGAIIFMSLKGYISPGKNGLVSFGITDASGVASGTQFTVNGGGTDPGLLSGPGTFTTGNGDSASFSLK